MKVTEKLLADSVPRNYWAYVTTHMLSFLSITIGREPHWEDGCSWVTQHSPTVHENYKTICNENGEQVLAIIVNMSFILLVVFGLITLVMFHFI
jgi:hypothetical protein